MVLEYELTPEDFLAFNLHFMRTSPGMRKQREAFRLTLTVVTSVAGLLVIGLLLGQWVAAAFVAVVTAVVMWLLSPALWYREAHKNLRSMASQSGLGTSGQHRLAVEESGLKETAPHGETTTPWTAIERVEETPDHAFIFFGPMQAFIVPRSVGDSEYEAALREIRGRCCG